MTVTVIPVKFKARIVAKGFSQIEGTHFKETFSPTLKMQSLRLILAFTAHKDWALRQLDVKTAFLIPTLPESETIYMTPPPTIDVPKGKALKLKRCIYGLRQASRKFYEHMNATLRDMGLTASTADYCMYTYVQNNDILAVLGLFVDDVVLAGDKQVLEKLAQSLMSRYKMTDAGTPNYLLGIAIDHDIANGKVSLSQEAYCQRLLETYNMSNCKPAKTPAAVLRLTVGDSPITPAESAEMAAVPYRNAVGALLYLYVATRPDIGFAVIQVAKFVSDPRPQHWVACKRIFRYLKGTADLSITYHKDTEFEVNAWSDSDWGGDLDTRRSTSGYVVTVKTKFGFSPISWRCKLQRLVALSSCESELISLVDSMKETLWMIKILGDLGFTHITPLCVYEDNQGCIAIATNQRGMSSRTKHVETRYFAVRQHIENNTIRVVYMETTKMLADILTKATPVQTFVYLRSRLGLTPLKPVFHMLDPL